MKKRIAMLLGITLCVAVIFTGCGKEEKETAEKTEKVKIETEKKEEKLRTIGKKTEDAFVVKLENKTGQEIRELKVRLAGTGEWTENVVPADQPVARDEKVEFCYVPEKKADSAAETEPVEGTEGDGSRFAVQESWDVMVTLADGKSYQMSGFPFKDMDAASIKLEDEVAFIEYKSKESKEMVSTKEQELGLKAKAAAEAEAKAAAEAQAAAEAEAKAAAEAQAVQEQYYEPVYEEPVYEAPSYDVPQSSEGCLQGSEGCLQ